MPFKNYVHKKRGTRLDAAQITGLRLSEGGNRVVGVLIAGDDGARVELQASPEFWDGNMGLPAKGDYATRYVDWSPVHWSPRSIFEAEFAETSDPMPEPATEPGDQPSIDTSVAPKA